MDLYVMKNDSIFAGFKQAFGLACKRKFRLWLPLLPESNLLRS